MNYVFYKILLQIHHNTRPRCENLHNRPNLEFIWYAMKKRSLTTKISNGFPVQTCSIISGSLSAPLLRSNTKESAILSRKLTIRKYQKIGLKSNRGTLNMLKSNNTSIEQLDNHPKYIGKMKNQNSYQFQWRGTHGKKSSRRSLDNAAINLQRKKRSIRE